MGEDSGSESHFAKIAVCKPFWHGVGTVSVFFHAAIVGAATWLAYYLNNGGSPKF